VPASFVGGLPPSVSVVPPSGVVVPPSGAGPPHGPQIPWVLPCGTSHAVPGQQSALLVHPPHAGTHAVPEHTYGGEPDGFGTHGAPLQQSALEAQELPASTHWPPAHRGTPTLSCLHVSCVSQLPAQQSHDELHDIVFSLHTSPLGLQPMGKRQIPSVPPPLLSHVTGLPDPPGRPVAPQQSVSFVQRSPTGWQPLAGWQTRTPVGPQGAQARLQQGPPHRGRPLSIKTAPPSGPEPPQSWPSTSPQLAGPLGAAAAQTPRVLPLGMTHDPVQQSPLVAHASPGCTQKDDDWHVPAEHSPEQHAALDEHALPIVAQAGLSDAQTPVVLQSWLQHWAFEVQASPSDWHCG
jgi:hypothetical protein